MTTSTRTRTTPKHPDPATRAAGLALVSLATCSAAVLAVSAPWALALARTAGPSGQSAGTVLLWTLGVLVSVAALAALSLRYPGARRPVRLAPLVGSVVLFACVLAAASSAMVTTIGGNADGAMLALGGSLWLSIAAGGVFGVASLPIAD